MKAKKDSAAKIRVARALGNWKQGDLARKVRVDPSALSRYEKEDGDEPPEAVKDKIAVATGASDAFVESVVVSHRVLQRAAKKPATARADHLAAEVASCFAAALAPALAPLFVPDGRPVKKDAPPTADDRAEAEALFRRLAPRTVDERLLVVAKGRDYRSAALCERLCDESEHAAAGSAEDALHWAELALRVAERMHGSEGKRAKGMGYSCAFLGNAQRVANDFPAVDAAFARSRAHYELGRHAAPGWFEEARALDLEASLRRNQGRFREALELLNQALAGCEPASRARILLKQAVTLEQDGRPERALLVLEEARPAIERGEGEPRFRRVLRFNVVKNLIQLHRAAEAEPYLAELRRLTAEQNNDLDSLRFRWLEAAVRAELGRRTQALAEMSAVRAEFAALHLPADAALVGLHEAVILLEDDRTAKVRTLVRAMKTIFDSLDLKREALAAYRLFVAAVEREAATVAMARELAQAIERAGSRFDGPAVD
ncbi:MAG TPA: hypothetical protein VGS22_10810 [Thermoanaerobaculia bacterium]|jgi:transcriptional regulator with XRE-family HTH domain|nr:hypothetical protein [Thermoanaerobaculia bacterium]